LYQPLYELVDNSLISDKFNPFFCNFHDTVYRICQNPEKESYDIRKMGKNTPKELNMLIHRYYKRLLQTNEEQTLLDYFEKDLNSSVFVIPRNYGGEILQKDDGNPDGGYGTGQRNVIATAMVYLYNVFKNLMVSGTSISNSRIRDVKVSSHGDNWLHSYPANCPWLSIQNQNYYDFGFTFKGEVIRSQDITQHELMGFKICVDGTSGLFVGWRPYAKTIKSLYFNRRSFKEKQIQAAYEAGIIRSLILVDCWENKSAYLLNALSQRLGSTPSIATDSKTAEYIEILESTGWSPKSAWRERNVLYGSYEYRKEVDDDLNWITLEKYKGEADA
jgi:hypothetical protein